MKGAQYRCDCGHSFGLPSFGSRVTGMSCGNCSRYWSISYNPGKILGTVSEWRCKECNSNKIDCRDTFWNKDKCVN